MMKASLTKTLLAACLVFSCAAFETSAASASAQTKKMRAASQRRSKRKLREPDVIFVPTPPETVDEMLRQAHLKKGDVLYDLGSGDGRIPIAAAKQYGVRAVGIDIDPKLVEEAREAARREGVESLVSFRNEDMFAADIRDATVVTLYLSNTLNVMMRPKLMRELRPGSLIISHDFRMGDWTPQKSIRVPWKNLYRTVYVWTVPRGGRYGKKQVSTTRGGGGRIPTVGSSA
ncbi:MAG TPA: methyltransferase domain-containing protein [Pyrinomonadaceae bacterium]|jgi:predicted O-methyltransferase YrrM|nr:methyltransferase domain-containing protein [Pyrinomonadaceae bacterium]